jgi:hypothetical protein
MSQENVEVVRRWLAATSDASAGAALAAVSEFWDAAADYYPIRKWPEAQPCHGHEEFSLFLARSREAFTRFDSTARWLVAVGDDRVLACVHLQWEGRGSGITLDGEIYYCYWLRHGRFFREEDHLTLSGALHALGLEGDTLEAVGLTEQDAHVDS